MKRTVLFGINGNFGKYFASNILADRDILGIDINCSYSLDEIASADTIIFCTPYRATKKILSQIRNAVMPQHTLIDICSVKSDLYDLAALPAQSIVSLHPLYSANSSPKIKHCVLCEIRGFLADNSFHKHFTFTRMTVDEHDKAMAVVQAAIHFQNYVTAHFLKRNSPRVKTQLGTILHTVLEKQLAQNPHMMAEIQTCNPHVRPAILNLKDSFDKMLDAVLAGDTQKVAQTVKSIAS